MTVANITIDLHLQANGTPRRRSGERKLQFEIEGFEMAGRLGGIRASVRHAVADPEVTSDKIDRAHALLKTKTEVSVVCRVTDDGLISSSARHHSNVIITQKCIPLVLDLDLDLVMILVPCFTPRAGQLGRHGRLWHGRPGVLDAGLCDGRGGT